VRVSGRLAAFVGDDRFRTRVQGRTAQSVPSLGKFMTSCLMDAMLQNPAS